MHSYRIRREKVRIWGNYRITTFQVIALGFFGLILIGAILLMLPVSSREPGGARFADCLFTATSAVCVTGLVVRDTATYWSPFGQAVILLLIQIGGMGVVTAALSLSFISGRKIGLMQRSIMQESISAPQVGGIVRLTRFIIFAAFGIELTGALLLLPAFIPEFGWGKGVWYAVSVTLEAHEYRHIAAPNAGTAILEASSHNPDIMLLDLGLPDMDGVEVIRKIRSWSNMPIIVISARSDDTDKIEALDAGADDYLTKPFSVDELLARLRVTLRRLNQTQSDSPDAAVFSNGELKIDYAAGCAYLQDEELHLTPIEYKLLCLLARNCGKVLTHKYITQQIWGAAWENNVASLRVFMATLRKKLEAGPGGASFIQTHVGIRYRMVKVNE